MKMKVKVMKTGTVNGRTYKAHLVYHVDEATCAAMQAQGIVKTAVPVVAIKLDEIRVPKTIVTKAKKLATGKVVVEKAETEMPKPKKVTTAKPTVTKAILGEEPTQEPKPRKPRTPKVTKEEKFEDGNG
jgi:hypothetical protein